jgi:hypothetical protein
MAKAWSGRPCSDASGIKVSACEASTAPPAKTGATANTGPLSSPAVARPTPPARSAAHAPQVPITVLALMPELRMGIAPNELLTTTPHDSAVYAASPARRRRRVLP